MVNYVRRPDGKSLGIIVLSCLLLTDCFPCKFGDWNCNASIEGTSSYQNFLQCNHSQQTLAKNILGEKYNNQIDSEIYDKCIQNHK